MAATRREIPWAFGRLACVLLFIFMLAFSVISTNHSYSTTSTWHCKSATVGIEDSDMALGRVGLYDGEV